MDLPSLQDIESKTIVHYWKNPTIKVMENIYFRIFWIDVIIPRGATSDWSSLPFFLRAFYSPYNILWLFAGLVHDYIYRTQFLPKRIADLIFYYILKKTAGIFIAQVFYQWVNYFWYIAWYNNSKKLQKFPTAKYDLLNYLCNKKDLW